MIESLLESIDKHLGGEIGAQKNFIVDAAVATAHCRGVSIAQSCRLASTNRSSFYRRVGAPGKRVLEDQALDERIRTLQQRHEGRYGIRRMTAVLRTDGHVRKPGHNQVARIMRQLGWLGQDLADKQLQGLRQEGTTAGRHLHSRQGGGTFLRFWIFVRARSSFVR